MHSPANGGHNRQKEIIMAYTPFIFWKQPGNKEIHTIAEPHLKKIKTPVVSEEGFLLFPYSKSETGYFISGKIEQTLSPVFPDITIKTTNTNNPESSNNYIPLVENAVKKINDGYFDKVVIARSIAESLPENFNLNLFFNKLCESYSQAFVYCIGFENEIWVGATPEVLLKKESDSFLTYALAGTKQINPQLAFGKKEKDEQQFVKNYIIDLLKNQSASSIEISEVSELNTGNLIHLFNEIRFKTTNTLDVINSLHPTPAVCGTPLKQAAAFITNYENLEREFYSGFLGPIFKNWDFSFWVNLRCGKITNNTIKFFAGAGIVKDSKAEAEWLETERKIDTLRRLL